MQYFPADIKRKIVDDLAKGGAVFTIALGQTDRAFHAIVVAKYRAEIRKRNRHTNMLAAELFTLGCHKLSLYYANYTRRASDGLGSIFGAIFAAASPQLIEQFLRGIIPKYLTTFPGLSADKPISFANFKAIKRVCDPLGLQPNIITLTNLVKCGCNKLAKWALARVMREEYDTSLAHTLLKRGNTSLIRTLMAANMDLFLGAGAITAAIEGNCEREIFDLLYGLGVHQNCHDIDNAVSKIKNPDVLTCAIEYSNEFHDHTQRAILNTKRAYLIEAFLQTGKFTAVALGCNLSAIEYMIRTPSILRLLAPRLLGSCDSMTKIISVCAIDTLEILLKYMRDNRPLDFAAVRRVPQYMTSLLNNAAELAVRDTAKSKIWLLHTYRFTLPNDIIQLMHKHDSLMLARIVSEQQEIPPLLLLTTSKPGSRIRMYYGDICSKLTMLSASTYAN